MKNVMQLKAIIKNLAKEKTYICTTRNAKFYVREVIGTNICFEI